MTPFYQVCSNVLTKDASYGADILAKYRYARDDSALEKFGIDLSNAMSSSYNPLNLSQPWHVPALGALTGGGLGILSNLPKRENNRNYLRDAILGSLAGGGLGTAGELIGSSFKNMGSYNGGYDGSGSWSDSLSRIMSHPTEQFGKGIDAVKDLGWLGDFTKGLFGLDNNADVPANSWADLRRRANMVGMEPQFNDMARALSDMFDDNIARSQAQEWVRNIEENMPNQF